MKIFNHEPEKAHGAGLPRMVGAAIFVVALLLTAAAAGFVGSSDDEASGVRTASDTSTSPLEQCIDGHKDRGDPMSAYDQATSETVQVDLQQFCEEYVAAAVSAESLEATRMTAAYVIVNGHVQHLFFEATEDAQKRLVATEVQVPEDEAQRRLAAVSGDG